jgi:hypothetical protein
LEETKNGKTNPLNAAKSRVLSGEVARRNRPFSKARPHQLRSFAASGYAVAAGEGRPESNKTNPLNDGKSRSFHPAHFQTSEKTKRTQAIAKCSA